MASRTPRRPGPCASACAAAALLCGILAAGPATVGGPLPEPLPLFPADNWWNADISSAPVDPNSSAYIDFINNGSPRPLHPDWGTTQSPGSVAAYGIPYIVVDGGQPKKAVRFMYGGESDGVDHNTGQSFPFYPIPDEAITQPHWIESGQPGNVDLRATADRHMLIVDRDNRCLYELYNVFHDGTRWHAGSGAFFDLKANDRRPDGWTSADAAGLAILPGLVRHDEVYGTREIAHAFRVTVRATNGYVYPASHRAGSNPRALPMGARLRLKAGVNIDGFQPDAQRIFRAMKRYGLIVADNGSDMFVSGTFDARWVNGYFNDPFRRITANDFDVIQLGYRPPAAPQTLYFPHVAVGGGYGTTVTMTNTGADRSTGNLILTSAGGAPLQADLLEGAGASASSFPVTLDSGATAALALGRGQGEARDTGWARLETLGGSIAGFATFRLLGPAGLQGIAGVFAALPSSSATIPVDHDESQQRYTGFAIANPGDGTVLLTATVRDSNGAVRGTALIGPLGPRQQIAAFLHQYLPEMGSFRGSMTLTSQDGGTFVVVALVQNRGLFTAIPVR